MYQLSRSFLFHYKRVWVPIVIFFAAEGVWQTKIFADDRPKGKITRIVIDPGHGGKDSGAPGKISKEKDIVLSVALKLGEYIQQEWDNVEVIYTRDKDVFIPLLDRPDFANKHHADLFISIHANANPNKDAYGAETYVMGLHTDEKNFEVAKKENSVIILEKDYTTRYEGFDPESPESYIIFSLMQNKYLEQSLMLASLVQTEFRERTKRQDRGVKQAGFLVLWKTSMPSILIELGFISNENEEKFLNSENGQDYLASAIYRAFKTYKTEIEKRSSFLIDPKSGKDTTQYHPLFQPVDTATIFFRIQLTSSGNPVPKNSPYFAKVRENFPESSIEEFLFQGNYKYFTGQFLDYPSAAKFAKEIKQFFPDAFIVATRNRKIIPLSDALK